MGDLGLIPGSGRSPGVRKWQPTPVFLPGEFYGQRSLAGYSSWSHKESDMTERLTLTYIVSVVEGAVVNKQRRASPLGASPFEEESQHLFYFIPFIFISWRLITLQYCSGFCHTLTWISHGFTCVPHPDPPSHLLPHPIPLGLPSAPAPSIGLMHPIWTSDLFHTW